MWFRRESGSVRRRTNRRRIDRREPILMVNARLMERQRERAGRVGALALAAAVFACAIWASIAVGNLIEDTLFSKNGFFTIRHLDLSSDSKLQPWHIREYAKIEEGINLFEVDIERVRRDLMSVPVVASVTVTRQLPDTLCIRVAERVAVARIGQKTAGYPLAVDREGAILGPSSLSPNLPTLVGIRQLGMRPGGRVVDPAAEDALRVLDVCDSARLSGIVRIREIDVSNPEFLQLKLAGGEGVLLGRTDLESRLRKLAAILRSSADRQRVVAMVDMTVDRNFPVQYR